MGLAVGNRGQIWLPWILLILFFFVNELNFVLINENKILSFTKMHIVYDNINHEMYFCSNGFMPKVLGRIDCLSHVVKQTHDISLLKRWLPSFVMDLFIWSQKFGYVWKLYHLEAAKPITNNHMWSGGRLQILSFPDLQHLWKKLYFLLSINSQERCHVRSWQFGNHWIYSEFIDMKRSEQIFYEVARFWGTHT